MTAPTSTQPDARALLTLFETVAPADKDKLDEIDARVWCRVNDKEFS